ncbi:MAG: alpha/beta hydrolase [Burkholderiales bacterium]|nr:alpha/beta hydrolase [Burkholderiales bacterium]
MRARRNLSAVLLVALASACAQTRMPPEIEARVRAIGPVIDPPKTAAIYAPLHPKEPYPDVRVTRDLKYGPDARHALDVFVPREGAGPRPVLIFVHGGAFVAGNKRSPGSPFYDNVMLAAARHGMVGVNMTYRLAPQYRWPSGAADMGAAVAWVQANIAAYGGDPRRVFIVGHSAGAVHAASYVAFPQHWKSGNIGLAGAVLVSGVYAFEKMKPDKPEFAYFGEKAGSAETSSLPGLLEAPIPLMLVYAELDPRFFIDQAKILNDALCAQGRCPRLAVLDGHGHISEMYAVNTGDESLTQPLMEFVGAGR